MANVLIVLPSTWGIQIPGTDGLILADELDQEIERIRERHSKVTIETVFNGTIEELTSDVYPRCCINKYGGVVVRLEGSPGVPRESLKFKPQKDSPDWEGLFANVESFAASYMRRFHT